MLHHSPASLISKVHWERKHNPSVAQLFISEGRIPRWFGESCSSHILKQKRAAQRTALSSASSWEHRTLRRRSLPTEGVLQLTCYSPCTQWKWTQVCHLPAEDNIWLFKLAYILEHFPNKYIALNRLKHNRKWSGAYHLCRDLFPSLMLSAIFKNISANILLCVNDISWRHWRIQPLMFMRCGYKNNLRYTMLHINK